MLVCRRQGSVLTKAGGRAARLGVGLFAAAICAAMTNGAPAYAARPTTSTGKVCTIIGTDGNDRLVGTKSADVICGLGGDDVIEAGAGEDVVDGGPGNDTLIGGAGNDTLTGGAGTDTASYIDHTPPVTATLDGRTNDGAPGETDNIATDIEGLTGGAGNDTLTGDNGPNTLTGGAGNDTLTGNGGDDTLLGQDGDDRLDSGDGNDVVDGGLGRNMCTSDVEGKRYNCTLTVTFPARQAAELSGRVVDAGGAPIAGLSVRLGGDGASWVTTGTDGAFTTLGQTGPTELAIGSFATTKRPGYPGYFKLTSTLTLQPNTPPVTITMPRPVQFTVHVTDQNTKPLAGATITTGSYLSKPTGEMRLWPGGPQYTLLTVPAWESTGGITTDTNGNAVINAFPGTIPTITVTHTLAGQTLTRTVHNVVVIADGRIDVRATPQS